CADRTIRASGGAFTFGATHPVDARGRRDRLLAANLLSRSRLRGRAPGRFVGRTAELEDLVRVARHAFHERRGAAITIVAPAGIGKSRLAEEFVSRLPAVAPDVLVVTTQCLPYGDRLTFWPLRGVLLRLAGVREDETPEAVRAAAVRWLRGLGVSEPEHVALLLATTVGLASTEVHDPSALADAWRIAFEAAAEQHPLVVVIEDLHWSSESLLDLLERIVRPPLAAPFLFVSLSRPELMERRPLWSREYAPDERTLTLGRLPDAALAPDLGPRLPAALEVLVDKEIASPTDERTFAFQHVLIRDVAYGVLVRAQRAVLHAAAARWFELQAAGRADAIAEIVAYHFREAALLARASGAPDDVSLSEKAVEWLSRAADAALLTAAHVQAVRFLRSAIELAPRDRHADLYERIGDAFAGPEAADA